MPAASAAAAALGAAPAKAVELAGKGLQAKATARIRKAAKDFEAILAEQLLKTARRSSSRSTLFPKSAGREIHEGMADEQFARAMTRGRGLGLGDFLADQVLRQTGTKYSSRGLPRPIVQGKRVDSAGGAR
jgi:Rod binding domain-containing protein